MEHRKSSSSSIVAGRSSCDGWGRGVAGDRALEAVVEAVVGGAGEDGKEDEIGGGGLVD